jgi:hypothetical protein
MSFTLSMHARASCQLPNPWGSYGMNDVSTSAAEESNEQHAVIFLRYENYLYPKERYAVSKVILSTIVTTFIFI